MSVASDIRSTLNDLVKICIDGQKGFELASTAINDPDLKNELMRYSMQRGNFASDLQDMVESTGQEPEHHGHISAVLHRGWMDIKKAISSNDNYAILAECERGEDAAVAAYREAVESDLQPPIADVIESQYAVVQITHDRIKDLRDAARLS